MFNPILQKKSNLLIYITVWLLLAVQHYSIIYFVLNVKYEYALIESSIYNFLFLVLGLSLWYPVQYITIDDRKIWKAILNHSIGALITSIIWVYSGYFLIINAVSIEDNYKLFLEGSLIWRFNIGVIIYLVITALYYVIFYYRSFKEKVERESNLQTLIKEAELKTLKYQINPHFIFNSLNSINSLTMTDPTKAQDMTIKLSTFLRNTLSKNEKQKNKLSEEINNINLYLDIEKVRFQDKFEFTQNINDQCKEADVPNMIMQPLFENAIKHGVYESIDKVYIKLMCIKERDYLRIELINNFDPDAVSKRGEGIGLKNIANRLKLFYNQDNLLTYKKEENSFIVNIFIPLENE